jgi:hypothetical protein
MTAKAEPGHKSFESCKIYKVCRICHLLWKLLTSIKKPLFVFLSDVGRVAIPGEILTDVHNTTSVDGKNGLSSSLSSFSCAPGDALSLMADRWNCAGQHDHSCDERTCQE